MELGISVYPNASNTEKIKKYIKICNENNFSKVFMHILDVDEKNKKEKVSQLKEIATFAQSLHMETLLDVNDDIYKTLDLDPKDLNSIKELGISTIRFDTGFKGDFLANLSRNNIGVNIQINASGFLNIEEEIFVNNPNMKQLSASHNFYPQEYTGLSLKTWTKQSKKLKSMGFSVGSFVSLPRDMETIGAWNINDGMVTIEEHRDKSVDLQARHFIASELADFVIISNMYATEKQIKILGELNSKKEYFEELPFINEVSNNKIIFDIIVQKDITKNEEEILFFDKHIGRGDYSEYFLRSSFPRNIFAKADIKPKVLKREYFEIGDVIIGNNDFGKYKAEILVVTKRIKYDPRKNLIGKIPRQEYILFKYINSWTHFKFVREGK